MSRKIVTAWLVLNVGVVVLYTVVPPLFFNDGRADIAGMPQILFWFTLMPFIIPALIAAMYFYDRSVTTRLRAARGGYEDGELR